MITLCFPVAIDQVQIWFKNDNRMLRIYKYDSPYEYKEFENYLFSTLKPLFDHENDKMIVEGVEYRISTINYIGLFNRLIDNLPEYTLTLSERDNTYAVFNHNTDFKLNINPKLQGCVIHIKVRKTTANDIIAVLPTNSYGAGISNNQAVLKGNINDTFILTAVYEGGEYDWLIRERVLGYAGTVAYEAKGYSETLGKDVDVKSTTEALDVLFNIQDQPPVVSLSVSPASGLREYGDTVSGVTLSAYTTKKTNPITSVSFRRNGTTINIVSTPLANGGTEVYTDNTEVNDNTTFSVIVSDGNLSATASRVFSFVYPFYWGVGAKSLTPQQIQSLTKSITTKNNKTVTTSPVNQVYYFAYPSVYGDLSSILDQNGFETIDGYTKRIENFTMLDNTIQEYFVYEFNSLTTQTDFTNTYKF